MRTKLLDKREEAPSVKTFVFKTEGNYEYDAGQFCIFSFEFKGLKHKKHFTISNSPTRENIELTTVISDSEYKKALDSLEIGHDVVISIPMGEFTIDKSRGRKIIFLMGGIGITPARSMLEYIADKDMSQRVTLFYSNRNPERIAFREELKELEKKLAGLRVIHTISDARELSAWKGETGRIDRDMIERNESDIYDSVFYVAGPPKFVEAMKNILIDELKIKKENMIAENFTGY